MRVAISQCLLGAPVRYDGGSKPVSEVMELAEKVEVRAVYASRDTGTLADDYATPGIEYPVDISVDPDITGRHKPAFQADACRNTRNVVSVGNIVRVLLYFHRSIVYCSNLP